MDLEGAKKELLKDPDFRKAYFGQRRYYTINLAAYRRKCGEELEYFTNLRTARKVLTDLHKIYGHPSVQYGTGISIVNPTSK